jgi:hypothetical protein
MFVVEARLAFYAAHSELDTDFDLLYHSARHLLQGENPYPITGEWSSYLFYLLCRRSW